MLETLVNYSWLIPLLPLLGAAAVGAFGAQRLRGQSHWPIWLTVGTSAVLSLLILLGMLGAEPNRQLGEQAMQAAGASEAQHAGAAEQHGGPGAADEHAAGPDGHVKAWTARWYTWIEAGNANERSVRMEEGFRRRLPGEPLGPGSAPDSLPPEGPSASGHLEVSAGALIDPLSAVMLCVVCGIGFLITVFAAGYMKGEQGYWRFFAYLGLFIFAMTVLVMGDNLIMLYLGWEGVGLCSYLLIGYYYERPAAREAAKKAFIVNRIGDFGFAIGILLIFYCFGTVSYFGDGYSSSLPGFVEMFTRWETYVPEDRHGLVPIIPFALMLGAFGKSAQFPLHVWLPDAMEGPTPVSALIHAATMVTAGVYMIARLGSVFFQFHWAVVAVALIGAFTALMAATIAMRQFDLKKVFAYSTISQLGYMFVGVAVLAPVAGVFHLVTHAFFKALLFLSSGVVMHAMLGHLDMRRMSGLKRVLPITRWLMLIGCLALAGFPLTAGFFSKDEIIHFAQHTPSGKALGWLLYLTLLVTAFLTAYYTFRLYFRVFEGPTLVPDTPAPEHHVAHDDAHEHGHASAAAVQAGDTAESGVDAPATHADVHGQPKSGRAPAHHDDHHHNHEPAVMILPLVILAVGALLAGLFNVPTHALGHFLSESPSFQLGYVAASKEYGAAAHADGFGFGGEIAWWGLALGAIISIAGIALAYVLHLLDRRKADSLAHAMRPAARWLEAKWYFDELYDALVVRPLRICAKIFHAIDRVVVDGVLVGGLGYLPGLLGFGLGQLTQRGQLQGYALLMIFGIAAILLVIFL